MPALGRITFLSSDTFGVRIADQVHRTFPSLQWSAITAPDRPKGRGKVLAETPFKAWARAAHIPVYTPQTKSDISRQLHNINPDLVIMASYGKILPAEVTSDYFCLNVHPSLLPQYRGATPVQTALRNGDTTTGVTLIRADAGMDTGDIVMQQALPIAENDTYGTLLAKLADLSATMAVDFIQNQFISDRISAIPQDHRHATYTSMIKKTDTELLETDTPIMKLNKIRSYSPTPGAYVLQHGQRVQILRARLEGGQLIPLELKPEGKRVMTYADYRLGNPQGLEV